jgi:ribulose-5-phosphate 4-epimerase/fuculose-1-phosphate aldolase
MKFSVIKNGIDPVSDNIAESIIQKFLEHGDQLSDDVNEIQFVLNLTAVDHPNIYRRRSQSVFVISLVTGYNLNGTARSVCYTTLVRSLSNMLICAVPTNGHGTEIYFTTPEAGFYHLSFDPEAVYQQILPIAGAHFATDNIMSVDLPERYCGSTPVVEKIKQYGRVLNELKVLPAPFPLQEFLPPEELRHLYKIFGITGASYGNLSARENIEELGDTTFWMTGRGVNKANLSRVGKDILLVKDFDLQRGTALVSVPAEFDPKARVSVDAIEHYLIYKSLPGVGAIVHVHAWMEGIHCTRQNYSCGTTELAHEVVALLRQTDNPECTAVGLKNHGLTITGPDLDEIFARIANKLQTEVPMFN